MDYEGIVEALGDNTEALEGFNSLVEANQTRVSGLEGKIAEAIGKKDKVMGLVRDNLGISEISEDTLKSFVGNADEALRAEVTGLLAERQDREHEIDNIKLEHKLEKREMKLVDELRSLDVGSRLRGERAMQTLVKDMLGMMGEDENGKAVFKENDQTMRNRLGDEMSVADVVGELITRDTDNFIFKEASGGGAKSTATPLGNNKKSINDIISAGLKY